MPQDTEKAPYPIANKIELILGSALIPLVGIIVGILNLKHPSRHKFCTGLIIFSVVWSLLISEGMKHDALENAKIQNQIATMNSSKPVSVVEDPVLQGATMEVSQSTPEPIKDSSQELENSWNNLVEDLENIDNGCPPASEQNQDDPTTIVCDDFTIDNAFVFEDEWNGKTMGFIITVNTNKAIKLTASAYDNNQILIEEMYDVVNVPAGHRGVISICPGNWSTLKDRDDYTLKYTWETYVPLIPNTEETFVIEDSHIEDKEYHDVPMVIATVRQTSDKLDGYGNDITLVTYKDGKAVGLGEFIIGDALKGVGTAAYIEGHGTYLLTDYDSYEIYY